MSLSNDVTLSENAQEALALAVLRMMDLDLGAASNFAFAKRLGERKKYVEALGELIPAGGQNYITALSGPISRALQEACEVVSPVHASMILSETMFTNPWSSEKLNSDVRRIAMKELSYLLKIPDPAANVDLILDQYLPRQRSFKKIALITLFSVAGGLVMAPHIGAAIGAAMGLSGAAATSAGLAALGFGSVAAGGFGMAGGTIVVGALAGAVGGGASLTAATSLIKSDPEIEALKLKVSLHLMGLSPNAKSTRDQIIQTIENGIKNAEGNLSSYKKQVISLENKLRELKHAENRNGAEISSVKAKIKDLNKAKIDQLKEEIELLKSSIP
jgi:hypothetical protein